MLYGNLARRRSSRRWRTQADAQAHRRPWTSRTGGRVQRHHLRQGEGGRRRRSAMKGRRGTGTAGDARPDDRDQGGRSGRPVRLDHRRPVLGRNGGRIDRPCQSRGRGRRPDRLLLSRRSDRDRASLPAGSPSTPRRGACRPAGLRPACPRTPAAGWPATLVTLATSRSTSERSWTRIDRLDGNENGDAGEAPSPQAPAPCLRSGHPLRPSSAQEEEQGKSTGPRGEARPRGWPGNNQGGRRCRLSVHLGWP